MRVAIATFTGLPPGFADDELLAAALERRDVSVDRVPWDNGDAQWEAFDAVVVRSTWDYVERREEFLAWTERVGRRLHNAPALVRWNSDKHYLGDLAADGIPVIPTIFVEPGAALPELAGEVVVKPAISAGGRDTGRFSPAVHDAARRLIETIREDGRTAMVQRYEPSVDTAGETAVLCLNGEPSHALLKRPVLRPDEVAPVRDDSLGVAEVMYDPGLVTASEANAVELELAHRVVEVTAERFGYTPLYARVDMVGGAEGAPTLMELEAVEPNFYLDQVDGAADRVAAAIIARL